MKITKTTKVSEILKKYGDIAEVMELFGIKRVGGFKLRKFMTKFISVRLAALVHRVPLDKFMHMLQVAVKRKTNNDI